MTQSIASARGVVSHMPISPSRTFITGTTTRTNFVTNPSFEASGTFWSTANSAGTTTGLSHNDQSTTHALYGTHAAMCMSAGGTGQFYLSNTSAFNASVGLTYTFSAYVYVDSSSPIFAIKCGIRDWSSFSFLAGFTNQTIFVGSWTRLSATYTVTSAHPQLRFSISDPIGIDLSNVNFGTFWVDGAMVEVASKADTYFDGNTGGSWSGLANKSISTLVTPVSRTYV